MRNSMAVAAAGFALTNDRALPMPAIYDTVVVGIANAQKAREIFGATGKPASIPYRANMTLLDAMIAVGGLSEYAAGNKARLVRFDKQTGQQKEYGVRIGDLLRRGGQVGLGSTQASLGGLQLLQPDLHRAGADETPVL